MAVGGDTQSEAEEAAKTQDMKKLYDLTRTLSGNVKLQSRPVRNKDGEILSKTEDQLKIWKEHFELSNLPAPVDLPELRPTEDLEHLGLDPG